MRLSNINLNVYREAYNEFYKTMLAPSQFVVTNTLHQEILAILGLKALILVQSLSNFRAQALGYKN